MNRNVLYLLIVISQTLISIGAGAQNTPAAGSGVESIKQTTTTQIIQASPELQTNNTATASLVASIVNQMKSAQDAQKMSIAQLRELDVEVEKVTKSCGSTVKNLQGDAKAEKKRLFWMSMAGVIAGAVLAPALTAAAPTVNKGIVAALSGFGSAAPSILREFSSNSRDGQDENQILTAIWRQFAITLGDGNRSLEDRYLSLARVKVLCSIQVVDGAEPGPKE